MNELLLLTSTVLTEVMKELVRRGDEEHRKEPQSQISACLSLAIRSVSLLCGMPKLLKPQTRDSLEVLVRAFLEARDLLMTFRFDQQGTRDKVCYWFEGKVSSPWKPEFNKCDEFWKKVGAPGAELSNRWSAMTAVAHPTFYAAQNSVSCATLWAANPPRTEDYAQMMEPKVADYIVSVATLIVTATSDFPGLISLGCDLGRMPNILKFQEDAYRIALPVLKNIKDDLPPGSYRTR